MDAPPHARRRRAAGIVMRLRDVWARDRALLVALAAAAASAVAFGRVTEDYLTNDPLARWDVSFSHWLADRRTSVGVDAFRTIADLGSPAVSACLALVVCVVLYRRAAAADALFLALVLVGAQVLNVALKLTFHRSRPEVAFVHLDTYSFPSGHAMIAIAVYGAFAFLYRSRARTRLRAAAMTAAMIAVVALISFSRLYLGVHYLSDVLGGLAAGATWLALAIALLIAYGDAVTAGTARASARRRARRAPPP